MATATKPAAGDVFTQTVDKTAEAITASYDSLLGAFKAWQERDQEVRSLLTNSYISTLESSIERSKENAKEAEAYVEKVAGLQREWFEGFSGRVREYQKVSTERYRSSVDEALTAWTEITRKQFDAFAGQVQRFGADFEKASDRVRQEGEAARAAVETATNGANGGAKKPGKTAI